MESDKRPQTMLVVNHVYPPPPPPDIPGALDFVAG